MSQNPKPTATPNTSALPLSAFAELVQFDLRRHARPLAKLQGPAHSAAEHEEGLAPLVVIKPIRLPADLKQSLEVQGIKLALQVKPTGLLVSDDRLWYGADIALEKTKAAAK